MNKRRLLKLAQLLETDAKNKTGVKFDLDGWGKSEKSRNFIKVDCNTTACAVGLACVSGAFRRDKLDYSIDDTGLICPKIPNPEYRAAWDCYEPRYLEGWKAVRVFFGLEDRQARKLFNPRKGKSSKGAAAELRVAKEIRAFVAAA